MKRKNFVMALCFLAAFVLWTAAVCFVDVQPIGPEGSSVGLAGINRFIHRLTGVRFDLYQLTDWLGLVPIFVCMGFGALGLCQWIKRKRIERVDFDILVLGGFYIVTIAAYLLFERVAINYRPVLIGGALEASYPSSTTMLVMCVMPTAMIQLRERIKYRILRKAITFAIMAFVAFMVIGRLLSGVHWFSDIVGGALLSAGLVTLYDALTGVTMKEMIKNWKEEEKIAHIHGWDFSHIDGRYTEDTDFPWDYRQVIGQYLTPEKKLLDIDTGGGEFLLSLGHPYENTAATENYPPNVQLCKETLLPLGIDFRQADGNGELPYPDGSFHVVIDRHGDFNPAEIYRVLKPGGLFISQQVGAENDRALVALLCGDAPAPFPEQYADKAAEKFRKAGFSILRQEEAFRPIRFFDVGALVWFARVIPWEFPDFSVDTHLEKLRNAQLILEETGCLEGRTHRFLIVAQKGSCEV